MNTDWPDIPPERTTADGDVPFVLHDRSISVEEFKAQVVAAVVPILRDEFRSDIEEMRRVLNLHFGYAASGMASNDAAKPNRTDDVVDVSGTAPFGSDKDACVARNNSASRSEVQADVTGSRSSKVVSELEALRHLSEELGDDDGEATPTVSAVAVETASAVRKNIQAEVFKMASMVRQRSLFDFHHVALDTVVELQKQSQRTGRFLRHAYYGMLSLVVLCLFAFCCWGIFKIQNMEEYAEMHREFLPRSDGPSKLPRIALRRPEFAHLPWRVSVRSCTILNGIQYTKTCTDQALQPCGLLGDPLQDLCLPAELVVEARFGSPKYTYVAIDLDLDPNEQHESGIVVGWEERLSLFSSCVANHLYTVHFSAPYAVEIYFKRVVGQMGTWLGFAGRQGNDESEDLLGRSEYMVKGPEYNRHLVGKRSPDRPGRTLTFYLRADLFEVKDFYEVYSVLRLMESLGGLWTCMSSGVSVAILSMGYLMIQCFPRKSSVTE